MNVVLVTAVFFAYIGLYLQPDLEVFRNAVRRPFYVVCGLLVGISLVALLYFLAALYRRGAKQLNLLFFLGMHNRVKGASGS